MPVRDHVVLIDPWWDLRNPGEPEQLQMQAVTLRRLPCAETAINRPSTVAFNATRSSASARAGSLASRRHCSVRTNIFNRSSGSTMIITVR
jgi:hypothetical protein